MKNKLILFIICIAFFSCEKDKEPSYDPSTIEFEIQTYGDLAGEGTVFDGKQTITRKTKEYQADDENGTYASTDCEMSDGSIVIDIVGWGNDIHPSVKQLYIRVPANDIGSYYFNADTSTQKHFFLHLETTYSSELRGGYTNIWGSPKTNLAVNITEITEERVKGSFSGELVYYYREELENGALQYTMDEEITNVNQPIINGTFDVFRSQY